MSDCKTVKIGDVCTIAKGTTGIMKATPGDYPMVTLAESRATHSEYQFDCGAAIIPLVSSTGHGHASMKRVHYQEGKFALGSILCAVVPKDTNKLNPKFLHLYLSYFKDTILVPLMHGAANVSLSVSKIKDIEIILPSIAVQLNIIEFENKLRLKKNDLSIQSTIQLDLIQKLREQIFQEAVTGKLGSGTENWQSESLEKLFKFIDYRGKTPNKINGGIRLITAKNVRKGHVTLEPQEFISKEEYSQRMTRGYPQKDDILITTEAPLGNVAILENEETISTGQRLITLQAISPLLNTKLMMYFMLSSFFQKQLLENATGVTALGIKSSKLKSLILPVPPMSEQQSILHKIEFLLDKTRLLEENSKKDEKIEAVLTQSFLQEAFKGL